MPTGAKKASLLGLGALAAANMLGFGPAV